MFAARPDSERFQSKRLPAAKWPQKGVHLRIARPILSALPELNLASPRGFARIFAK